jgi:RimJ/RimL family protein N-acetyltransferase
MFKPIYLQNEHLLIHPFGPDDLRRYGKLVEDVFLILSDEQTLKYLPGKRLQDLNQAEGFLQAVILNYHAGRNYLHFITDKSSGRVIGMIDLISPELAREHYDFSSYPHFIEFYLSSPLTGCQVMTKLLPPVIELLLKQGIPRIGAIVHRQNIAAKKVLEKSRFSYTERFDIAQDYYEAK